MGHKLNNIKVAADRSITFGNFMNKLADVYGDKTCFILDRPLDYSFLSGMQGTYKQWCEFTDRVAHVMKHDLGIEKGERVLVDLSNRMEIPFLCFGIMKAGGVAVPINFMLTQKEIAFIAGDSGAKSGHYRQAGLRVPDEGTVGFPDHRKVGGAGQLRGARRRLHGAQAAHREGPELVPGTEEGPRRAGRHLLHVRDHRLPQGSHDDLPQPVDGPEADRGGHTHHLAGTSA